DSGSTSSTATGTTDSGSTSSTATGTTDSGSTSSTATGTTDSGSTSSTATGTTASDTTSTTSTDTAASGSTSGTGTTVTGEPVVSGDAVNPLENDEAVNQTGLDYSIDSSKGRWFEETKTDLFSESDTKSVKAEIKALREEIKTVLASYKNGNTDKQNGKARIKQIREKIAALRSQIGNGGRVQQGIYTNWANENLYLNIKKGEPGWYRIIIVAKNRGGTLPEDYSRFTFSVNNSSNDTVAGISVKASDNVYFRGSADVYLENPSGAQLNLLWTNDAYIENKDNSNGKKNSNAAKSVYDTNINIKKVVLKKIKEPGTKTVNVKHFNGDEFSSMDGRWFFENKSAYTFWSNQVIGYTFKNLEEGEYEVTITAKNYDSLPLDKNYKEFNVEVDSDYDSATMNIRADDKNWNHEKVTMNFAEGDTTLFVTWTNDSYKEGEYDSNIMIKTISIKKVQKSSLTAFLLRTKPGNKVFILGAFLMLSGLIFGIYLKNKTSHNA
ncbi:MAG TPA: hypothetical protein PKG60_05000, partial [Spirochaetota bacterium]|nr:hypothetical protein [Spirochaetota bacterium]